MIYFKHGISLIILTSYLCWCILYIYINAADLEEFYNFMVRENCLNFLHNKHYSAISNGTYLNIKKVSAQI